MERRKLLVHVGWTDHNFCCSLSGEEINGTVVETAKTLEELKKGFAEGLKFHIEGCIEDGDILPDYIKEGDFEIMYILDVPAILRDAERFTTLSAISDACGINKKQLSHYATGEKKARPDKREKIIEGLHKIGREALAFS
ncbi:MAG: CopG family transcriptional regulator [Muribaculaceae bacterium]|nr:CopG family transcriptional regulator [Muribaculaceae bacterium]